MGVSDLLEQTLFVIVLYQRKPEQSPAYNGIIKLAGRGSYHPLIFIYDNSAEPCHVSDEQIHYVHDAGNSGVSTAYNRAYVFATSRNKKWLMLLDQDTLIDPGILTSYSHAVAAFPPIGVFTPVMADRKGIVSPFRLIWGKGVRVDRISPGMYSFEKYCIINSGLLISVNAFEKAGGFNEHFPLDLSDVVFCERLLTHGEKFVVIPARCEHQLSAESDHNMTAELHRFRMYCNAMKRYKKISRKFVSLGLCLLTRGLRLSWKHKTFVFIQSAMGIAS